MMQYAKDTDGRGFLLGDDGRAHEIKVAGNVFPPPQVGTDAAELAALRRDAERYRYLRESCGAAYSEIDGRFLFTLAGPVGDAVAEDLTMQELCDFAIDAAMRGA